METKGQLAAAIIEVMKVCRGIEKSTTVGTGNNSYKAVSDKDVKTKIGDAMIENGLCILPIGVDSKTHIDRWEQESTYNGNTTKQTKQSVFSEVDTKYLLLHTSGESIELAGHGHGTDTQDKAAGKATTYALKNTLLYTFMVATGKIDDTDNTHSNDLQVPPPDAKHTETKKTDPKFVSTTHDKPWLNENTDAFLAACEYIKSGKGSIERIERDYQINKATKAKLEALIPKN